MPDGHIGSLLRGPVGYALVISRLIGFVLQVLRWSALAFGVFYGFSHQRTITATQKAQHEKQEWESKQKVIDQAKAEYAKKHPQPAASSNSGKSQQEMRTSQLRVAPSALG